MDPKLREWIELVSTAFGALGFAFVISGLGFFYIAYRLWRYWNV